MKLREIPSVSAVRIDGHELTLTVAEPHVALPHVLERIREVGADMTRLSIRHGSLEDVFVKLTGRHLRDGEARTA
jgi:ABC-2 type transport system ATP-binding protein